MALDQEDMAPDQENDRQETDRMSSSPRISDLNDARNAALVDAVYRQILEPSFPEAELETLENVHEGLTGDSDIRLMGLCALSDDGEPLACIVAYQFPRSGVLLIGYVAVREGARDQGLGGLLMDEAARRWYEGAGNGLVMGEVEDPRHHSPALGADPVRRVQFYARRGVLAVEGPYFQPRLRESSDRVQHLLLTVGGYRQTQPPTALPGPLLADFLGEYLAASAEGERARDRQARWLVDWYRERPEVPLRPIQEYKQLELPEVPPDR
jgi:predicted N-acetyltransferase YhbS